VHLVGCTIGMWYEIFVLLDLGRTFSTRCESR